MLSKALSLEHVIWVFIGILFLGLVKLVSFLIRKRTTEMNGIVHNHNSHHHNSSEIEIDPPPTFSEALKSPRPIFTIANFDHEDESERPPPPYFIAILHSKSCLTPTEAHWNLGVI